MHIVSLLLSEKVEEHVITSHMSRELFIIKTIESTGGKQRQNKQICKL